MPFSTNIQFIFKWRQLLEFFIFLILPSLNIFKLIFFLIDDLISLFTSDNEIGLYFPHQFLVIQVHFYYCLFMGINLFLLGFNWLIVLINLFHWPFNFLIINRLSFVTIYLLLFAFPIKLFIIINQQFCTVLNLHYWDFSINCLSFYLRFLTVETVK